MADKNDLIESTEEFHFTPEEQENTDTTAAFTGAPDKSNKAMEIFNRIDRRKVLMVIGGIIVFFAFYKLISLFIGAELNKKSVSSKTKVAEVVQSVNSEIKPSIATTIAPPSINQPLPQSSISEAQQNQINALETQVSTLASNVSALQENLSTLNQQISDLTAALQKQNDTLEKLKTTPKKAIVHKAKKKANAFKIYYVIRSVIPGRAWLQDSQGNNLSVTIGDILPYYGRIVLIDPVRGKVVTSKNFVIRY